MRIVRSLVMVAAGTACGVAVGAETTNATPPPAAPSAGMRAYIDPATGRLAAPPAGTTSEDRAAGLRAPDFSRMREERLHDGTVLLHHDGQFRMVSVVRRGADGRLQSSCEPLPAQPVDDR